MSRINFLPVSTAFRYDSVCEFTCLAFKILLWLSILAFMLPIAICSTSSFSACYRLIPKAWAISLMSITLYGATNYCKFLLLILLKISSPEKKMSFLSLSLSLLIWAYNNSNLPFKKFSKMSLNSVVSKRLRIFELVSTCLISVRGICERHVSIA